jgi:sRNA-binding regulator protein Hfq
MNTTAPPSRPPFKPSIPPGKFAPRQAHNKPERKPNEQVRILIAMRDEKALVQITLLTGVALVGQIRSFYPYTLVSSPPNGGHELSIFKSGLLTVARKVTPATTGAPAA